MFGYLYIDTGAMYRALAVLATEKGIPLDNPRALGEMASSAKLDVSEDNGVFRVWINGREVTEKLRAPETDRAVKFLAMARPVREVLVSIQRELAKKGGVVMEGRDIASVVIPDAEVKVFLTADLEERARRRWKEMREKGIDILFDDVLREMKERDKKDLERDWGRLVKVDDAVLIDSTDKSVDEVCSEIVKLCEVRASCFTSS